jgi:Holliday junction resolvasome RuvABC endonuclease subunit
MKLLRVAGIDPSLSNFGMVKGTVDLSSACPVFDLKQLLLQSSQSDKANQKSVRKNSDDIERARLLHNAMQAFIQDVDIVMVEVPVGSQSARAMASYGICVGILASVGVPMIQVTPTEVKMAAVGSKTATKAEMIQWATGLYPEADWLKHKSKGEWVLGNKNEHLADAVGAVFAGARTDQFKQATVFWKACA